MTPMQVFVATVPLFLISPRWRCDLETGRGGLGPMVAYLAAVVGACGRGRLVLGKVMPQELVR